MAADYAVNVTHETASIAGASRRSYYPRLKDMFAKEWEIFLHKDSKIAGCVQTPRGRMGGRKKVAVQVTARPASAGMPLFEGARLPTPRSTKSVTPYLKPRYTFTRLRWTEQVEAAARAGDKAAWSRPKQTDIRHALDESKLRNSQNAWGGRFNVCSIVSGYTSGTKTATLFPRSERSSLAADYYKNGHTYLQQDLSITLVDAGHALGAVKGAPAIGGNEANTVTNEVTVASVTKSEDAPAVVFDVDVNAIDSPGAYDAATGDAIVFRGSRRDTFTLDDATLEENMASMYGISDFLPNISSYAYGLSQTTYPQLRMKTFDNAGSNQPYSQMRIMLAADQVADEGRGMYPDTLLCHSSVRREHVAENDSKRRLGAVQEARQGFKPEIAYNHGDVTMLFKVDHYMPIKQLAGISTPSWGYWSEQEMRPLAERFVPDFPQVENIWMRAGNAECTHPGDNFMIDDLEVSTTGLSAFL